MTKIQPIWVTMPVSEAMRDYPGCLAGWWYADAGGGGGQLDMHDATVTQAVSELRERACSDDHDRAAIMAGTIEVAVGWSHPEHAALRRLLDAQTHGLNDILLAGRGGDQ